MTAYTFNGGDVTDVDNYTPNDQGLPDASDDVTSNGDANSGSVTVNSWSGGSISGATITADENAENVTLTAGTLAVSAANFAIENGSTITLNGGGSFNYASTLTVGDSGQGTFNIFSGADESLPGLIIGASGNGLVSV